MTKILPTLAAIILFWLCAALTVSLTPRLAILGGGPDFLLVCGYCCALISRPGGGAFAGFVSGVLMGGLTGATLTHFTIVRTLGGFGMSFLGMSGLELNPRKAGVILAIATLLTQILHMLVAPPPEIGIYLRATLVTAMYNGVLAIPLYSLLCRLFRPKVV